MVCSLRTRNGEGQPLYTQVDAAALNMVGECLHRDRNFDCRRTIRSIPSPPACLTIRTSIQALGNTFAFREVFLGDTWKPRLAIGIGVNWNSPFGPFRIDFSKVLLKREGDDTKAFTFNVGTQF